jgi:5-(carboxyamino)imidazole ribonucleotide synthase
MNGGSETRHPSPVTRHVVEPGSTLGVLGGGQLGAMFTMAAKRLGYRVAVWDPDPDAPALKLADLPLAAPFTDTASLEKFSTSIKAATYEWENIPVSMVRALEQRVPVRPAPRILQIIQNRLDQKTFLAEHRIAVAPFQAVASPEQLTVPDAVGFPALCKTATLGYDGKGQWRLSGPDDVRQVQNELRGQLQTPPLRSLDPEALDGQAQGRWIVEQFLPFEKELSVLVVRGADGDRRFYPVAENVHEAGILRTTRVPAAIDPEISRQAAAVAGSVIEALDGIGVFCVELFLMKDGRFFVNEVAPRPHNSGHYTLDACTVSQFEQQVRAVCGLPLGETKLASPAVMVNLIGEDFTKATTDAEIKKFLSQSGAKLHVYGKKSVRPGRKMGHVTFMAASASAAWESASTLKRMLG